MRPRQVISAPGNALRALVHYPREGSVDAFVIKATAPHFAPWRYSRDLQGKAVNQEGDLFRGTVTRTGVGSVNFQGEQGTPFVAKLIQNLLNTEHTLELITADGPVRIDAFDVFEPPLHE